MTIFPDRFFFWHCSNVFFSNGCILYKYVKESQVNISTFIKKNLGILCFRST